jgi:hypothetical protein
MAAYTFADEDAIFDIEETRSSSKVECKRFGKMVPYTRAAINAFCKDLLGGYRVIGRKVIRIPPRRHPIFTWCRATKINIKPWGQTFANSVPGPMGALRLDRIAQADAAAVEISYSLPEIEEKEADKPSNNEEDEKDLCSESWEFGGKNLALPNQFMKWKDSGSLLRQDEAQVSISQPQISMTMVRHRVLFKPVLSITALGNCINKNPFTILGETWPAETVRFEGASMTRRLTTGAGVKFYEMTYKFEICPIYDICEDSVVRHVGWNRVFNPVKAWYEPLVWVANTSRYIHYKDEDVISQSLGGRTVKGFNLLFHPIAM